MARQKYTTDRNGDGDGKGDGDGNGDGDGDDNVFLVVNYFVIEVCRYDDWLFVSSL